MYSTSPIRWKKSFADQETHNATNPTNASSIPMSVSRSSSISGSTASPIGIQKRRKSSFNSLYSPYTRRRSFLSKNMIENESVQCYRLASYSSQTINNRNNENIPSFSINLSESQGFLWNQDLFASSYQQSQAGVHNMMSMSDGSYYLNGHTGSMHHSNSKGGMNDNSNSFVDVIDVVLDNDDYKSDIDIVREVVKVDNYGEDDEDEDDDDDDEEVEAMDVVDPSINNHSPNITRRITRSMDRRMTEDLNASINNNTDADAEYEDDDEDNIFVSDL